MRAVLAFNSGGVIFGIVVVIIGVSCMRNSADLAEGNRRLTERVVPGRAGQWLGGAFGSGSYRTVGILGIAIGGLVLLVSLVA